MKPPQAGFTLVEVVVGIALLSVATGALFLALSRSLGQAAYLGQLETALNEAQGQLEKLAVTNFDSLAKGSDYAAARTPQPGLPVPVAALPQGNLSIRIRPDDVANPLFLDVVVSACWNANRRIIGEDRNCNGRLDAGEDLNANGWLDSPAMVSTRIARMTD